VGVEIERVRMRLGVGLSVASRLVWRGRVAVVGQWVEGKVALREGPEVRSSVWCVGSLHAEFGWGARLMGVSA